MKIYQYNSFMRTNSCEYKMSASELYDKLDIKTIHLAYHDVAAMSVISTQNIGQSGYVVDSLSFHYFILETFPNKKIMRLTFNLPIGLWELSDLPSINLNERLNKLEKQQAINLMEFIDLFGM